MLRRLEDWGGCGGCSGGCRCCCIGSAAAEIGKGVWYSCFWGCCGCCGVEGGEVLLLLLLLLLRLLRCVSFLCWGSELWLQGLGGLSATVRLDVAGAGARPSSAC